jgi:hypothetical protein
MDVVGMVTVAFVDPVDDVDSVVFVNPPDVVPVLVVVSINAVPEDVVVAGASKE